MLARLRDNKLIAAGVVAVLLVAVVAVYRTVSNSGSRTFTVVFSQTKDLYVGDDVAILGVTVGKILSINPNPDDVVVRIKVDSGYEVPADAKAVLVAPSLVSVRRVELTPAYGGGPTLQNGATIPISRTAIPVEWDDVKAQLIRLTTALGPEGANKNGSLSNLVRTTARNLNGNGTTINNTITSLSRALQTLSDGRGDLFATVRNLEVFTEAIEQSDASVAGFNQRLASVSQFLSSDRVDLALALKGLEQAFPKVETFLRANRGSLTETLSQLRGPARLLADNRQNLADILQIVPGTLSNLYNIINPDIPALTGEFAINNFSNVAVFVCSALLDLGGTSQGCITALTPVAKYLGASAPPIGLAPIIKNGYTNVSPVPPGEPTTQEGASTLSSPASSDIIGQVQKMLAGAK